MESISTQCNEGGAMLSNTASEAIENFGNDDPKQQNFESAQVQFLDDSDMSPLEYETDSDEETANDTIEKSASETQGLNQLQLGTTTGINCTSSKQASSRIRAKKIAKCSMCCVELNYRSDSLTHSLANGLDSERAYFCYLCKKAYKSKQWLRTHMNSKHIDHVEVRFSCSFPKCLKSFTQKSTLNRHIKIKHI